MLSFITDAIIAVLSGYLSLTGTMAYHITNWLPAETTYNAAEMADEISQAPNSNGLFPIPDILINNPSFQRASVIESQDIATSSFSVTDALVNIYCTYSTPTSNRQTTGSGFIVSERGVILTNAHVAQFFLLAAVAEDSKTQCIVRTGDPATPQYEADLLYISPAWIQNNANLIATSEPKGTGERDYALLYLKKTLDNAPMPAKHPYINIDTALVRKQSIGETVTIGGYPAVVTERTLEVKQSIATTTLLDVFTFGTSYGDIYQLGGTSIGVQGISGGPVVRNDNTAIGLIVTRGNDEVQGSGSLNAITISYIDRTMREETGFGFISNISGDLAFRSNIFKQTLVPFLALMLQSQLD